MWEYWRQPPDDTSWSDAGTWNDAAPTTYAALYVATICGDHR